jgi:drug/metabolite transporter (DMT)-like permease
MRNKTLPPPRLWFGAMALGGLAFGLIAERRPFGDDVFAHPLVAFFILAGAALIALRMALARPVPEVIPERALLLGCFLGLGMFLVGNWVGVHALPSVPAR